MKREARNHSKTKRLCRKLDIPSYQAWGILEGLWHLTASDAWRGDIGKLSNEEIAIGLDYRGDEDKLIDALVHCGWLDVSQTHRLLVHDWPEHADNAVKKRDERATKAGQIGFYKDMFGHVETKVSIVFPHTHAGPEPEPEPEPEPSAPPVYAFDDDPLEHIPEDAEPMQCAALLLERAEILGQPHVLRAFAGAVKMLGKVEHCSIGDATRRLLDRVRAAQSAGISKWALWLADDGWKQQARASPATLGMNFTPPDERPLAEQMGPEWCAKVLRRHTENKTLTGLEAEYIRSLKLASK